MRHKKRTFLTAGVISAAVFLFLSLDSHLASMDGMAYENIIDFESSHLQIATEEYWEEREDLPLRDFIYTDAITTMTLEDTYGFSSAATLLDFEARLSNFTEELPVRACGLEIPAAEVLQFEDYFVDGNMFTEGEYQAVIGKQLADLMNLEKGDYILLIFRTKDSFFNTLELEISGLIHTPNPVVNESMVYLPPDIARQALNAPGQFSRILVRLSDRRLTDRAAEDMGKKLEGSEKNLKIIPWHQLEAVAVSQAKNAGNRLILFIILLIAAIGIINSVILSALERIHEIGIMKAMGLTRRSIVWVFVMESTAIAALGASAGCILGAGGVALLARYGIDYTALFGELSQYGIPVIGRIYGVWIPSSFLFIFFFSVIVATIASILPSRWAARKNPVEAIHRRNA